MKRLNTYLILCCLVLAFLLPSFFVRNNGFNKSVVYAEDYDTWDGTTFSASDFNNYFVSGLYGSGSEVSPYIISTAKQFASLHILITSSTYSSTYNNQNIFYMLNVNVDLNNFDFTPIGLGSKFKANFDGDYNTIKNLKFKFDANQQYVGLFSDLNNAIVENLIISNVNFYNEGIAGKISNCNLGIVCSQTDNSIVSNCKVIYDSSAIQNTISILGDNSSGDSVKLGGIVAQSNNSQISNCENHYNLKIISRGISAYCGGVVASSLTTTIQNCANYGKISNNNSLSLVLSFNHSYYFGGLVGQSSYKSKIINSANFGEINFSYNGSYANCLIGGLVGYNYDENDILTLSNSYSACSISYNYPACEVSDETKTIMIGGLIGHCGVISTASTNTNNITNCFAYNSYTAFNSTTSNFIGEVIGRNNTNVTITGAKHLEHIDNFNVCGTDNNSQNFSDCIAISSTNFADQDNSLTNFNGYSFYDATNNPTGVWYYESVSALYPNIRKLGYQAEVRYNVKFYVDSIEQTGFSQSIRENKKILLKPDEPEKTGYNFLNWSIYDDINEQYNEWNFDNDLVVQDTNLYAVFGIQKFSINFYIDGILNSTLTQSIDYNNKSTSPDISSLISQGKEFDGWYENSDFSGEKFDFNTAIIQNKILYGQFSTLKCDIEFYYLNANYEYSIWANVSQSNIDYGSNIGSYVNHCENIMPKTEGYTLVGWYDSEDLTKTIINFATYTINKQSLQLYAKYTINQYTIIFNTGAGKFSGGETTYSITKDYNTDISTIVPTNPTRTDYDFSNWYKDSTCNDAGYEGDPYSLPQYMPAIDNADKTLNLYAKWTKGLVKVYIYAYFENIVNGILTYENGIMGGSVGFSISCGQSETNNDVEIDSNKNFYAIASDGFTLEGAYLSSDFTGQTLSSSYDSASKTFIFNTGTVGNTGKKIYVKFTITRCEVELKNDGDFTLSGSGTYLYGDEVTITCTENTSDYKFYKWMQIISFVETDFENNSNLYFTFNVLENMSFTAKTKIKLTINQADNGKIEAKINSVKITESYIEKSQTLVFTAISDKGYQFLNWTGEFNGNLYQFSCVIESPIIISCTFESKTIFANISASDTEHTDLSGTTNVVGAEYKIGDIIILSVLPTPSLYYEFNNWTTNASGIFNKNISSSQEYIFTADDAEIGVINFVVYVNRVNVRLQVMIYGSGSVNMDGRKISTSYDEYVTFNKQMTISMFSPSNMFEFEYLQYKENDEEAVDVSNLIENEEFNFQCDNDIILYVKYKPMMWTDVMVKPSGKGTNKEPYIINTVEELAYASYSINYGEYGDYIPYYYAKYYISNDLDFAGRYWTPIGIDEDNKRFDGILDRNYCNLKNITLLDGVTGIYFGGLFGCIGKGKIINESKPVYMYIGIVCSIVFGTALILIIIISKKSRKRAKKVIVLPADLLKRK